MDNNQNNQTVFQSPTPAAPQGQPGVPPASPPPPASQAQPQPTPTQEEYLAPHSHSPFGLLLKIAIGIVGVIAVIFIIFGVVLPLFSNKEKKVTLTYWGLFEDPNVMQPILADFHKQYPSITVEYKMYKVDGYKDRLSFRIKNGDGPDIFRFHNSWVAEIQGDLLPLPSDVITVEEFKKQYYAVANQDLIRGGALYGIPLEIDTLALFTNNELFKAAGAKIPIDWGEFQDTAIGLTTKDENGKIKTAGAALGTIDNINHAHDIISLFFIQKGVDITNITKDTAKAVDALVFYTSFVDPNGDGSRKVWDETLDPSLVAFSKGNLAMYFGYSWDIFAIKAANPTLEFTVSSVPHLPKTKLALASYWVEGVSSKSKNQKEALLFMKYLTKKEVQQKLYTEEKKTRLFGEPYANKELGKTLKDDPNIYPFIQQAEDGASSFFIDYTYDGQSGLVTSANKYLTDAVNSITKQSGSPETAVKTLANGISQVLSRCCPNFK